MAIFNYRYLSEQKVKGFDNYKVFSRRSRASILICKARYYLCCSIALLTPAPSQSTFLTRSGIEWSKLVNIVAACNQHLVSIVRAVFPSMGGAERTDAGRLSHGARRLTARHLFRLLSVWSNAVAV